MASMNQFKKNKKYPTSGEEPPFGHGLGHANAQKSLKNLQKADFIHDLSGVKPEQLSYMEGNKDFAASAEALGVVENRGSRHGDDDHPGNLNRLNYNRAFNLNVNSQDIDGVNHVKLSELDVDAMDSPRTSKLLAVRDQTSSMATSSNNQFGGGDTSELLNPQVIAAAAHQMQQYKLQQVRPNDHQSSESLGPLSGSQGLVPQAEQKHSRLSQNNQASYIDQSLSEGLKQHSSAGPGQQHRRSNITKNSDLEEDQDNDEDASLMMNQLLNLQNVSGDKQGKNAAALKQGAALGQRYPPRRSVPGVMGGEFDGDHDEVRDVDDIKVELAEPGAGLNEGYGGQIRAEEGDEMEVMERLMRNKVNQAKQLVYQQHLELDSQENRGIEGFDLDLGDDAEEDRSGKNFDNSDIDYARFLHGNEGRQGPHEGQTQAHRGADGSKTVAESTEAFEGNDSGGSSFGKQFKQFVNQDGAQDAAGVSPPGNYNFETDLQSNEISLQDMHKRFNHKNELLDDEEEPMLSGINSLNYMDSQQNSSQKGKAGSAGIGANQSSVKLQKFEEQQRIQQSQQQQIHNELKELLAQSSNEQLLEVIDPDDAAKLRLLDEDDKQLQRLQNQLKMEQAIGAGRGELPRELLAEADKIFMGEQPVDSGNKRELTQLAERERPSDEKLKDKSLSPPLVTSAKGAQKAAIADNDPQNLRLDSSGAAQAQKRALAAEASPPKPEKPKKQQRDLDRQPIDQAQPEGTGEENDSFHRLYNKEIKVNQDEIPLLLLELTDIAYKFIKKDQYEKAYVLLQKTESVLEVVNLDHSKRDRYFAYITYHNMAMCFQKLGMLEECIIYLRETIQVLEKQHFFKDVSISLRMRQSHMLCQLKLQLCAILSQTQKHSEAMENAKYSVRLAHQILRDMYDLCVFYSNKIKFKDDFASLSLLLMDEVEDNQNQNLGSKDSLKGAGDSSSADKRGGGKAAGEGPGGGKHTKSEINEKLMQKQFVRENSPVRDIPYNILEESISMIERTALKLLPIMKELGNRLAGTQGKKGLQAFHTAANNEDGKAGPDDQDLDRNQLKEKIKRKLQKKDRGLATYGDEEDRDDLSQLEEDIKDTDIEVKAQQANSIEKPNGTDQQKASVDKSKQLEDQVDMRTVLGFLNQNEWILNLNIGNIMQIQPVRMRDFMQMSRNEHQLSRESFLEKLQLLIVSYFCVSTEMRFIVQQRQGFMKAEVKKEKELEQEYWHVKALDIACAFLPSECPLFNHILLSYQKHHDPTMQQIEEDKEQEDEIRVLRPLRGIENSKYQPMIRELKNVYIDVADIPMSPLSTCFDKRLKPKKVKTSSINIQTEPIEEPKPPLMHSQSISVQDDLKFSMAAEEAEGIDASLSGREGGPPKKKYADGETQTDTFDVNNAYLDLHNQPWHYQEQLIAKLMEDPRSDKHAFLSKLISRVQLQDREAADKPLYYQHGSTLMNSQPALYGPNAAQPQIASKNLLNNNFNSTNTQSQNVYSQEVIGLGHHQHSFTGKHPTILQSTLSVDPHQAHGQVLQHSTSETVQNVYGGNNQRHVLSKNKGNKITQSGQIHYNPGGVEVEFTSFEQRNHVRSLYGDATSDGATTIMAAGVKHQIVSQSLAPLHSVMATEQKTMPNKRKGNLNSKSSHPMTAQSSHSHLNHHKKTASISGNSHDFLANQQSEFVTNVGGAVGLANQSYNKHTLDHSSATMQQRNTANHLNNSVNSHSLIENSHFGMGGPSSGSNNTFLKKKQKSTEAVHGRAGMAASSTGLARAQGHRGSYMHQNNNEGGRLRMSHNQQAHVGGRLLKNEKHYSNINLSNQKNQRKSTMKGPSKYIQNYSYNKERPDSRISAVSGHGGAVAGPGQRAGGATGQRASSNSREKQSSAMILNNQHNKSSQSKRKSSQQANKKVHKIPTTKQKEDSLIKQLDDVMSSSSSGSSNADPDLHPEPQSSSRCSDMMNNTNPSPSRMLVNQSSTSQEPKATRSRKREGKAAEVGAMPPSQAVGAAAPNLQGQRASSEVTNYTSGHSALKAKGSKQRLQAMGVSSSNITKYQKQLAKLQQQQNYVTSIKQAKQKQVVSGGPLVPKKKTKVLSRKKYGSDRSSNSPTTNAGPQRLEQAHGYSIAQQPVSIFDHANAHSISKLSLQLPQQHSNQLNNNSQSEVNLQTGVAMPLSGPGDSSAASLGVVNFQNKAQAQGKHTIHGLQSMNNIQSQHLLAAQNNNTTGVGAQLGAADSKLSLQNHDLQQTAFHSVGTISQSLKPSSSAGQRQMPSQQHSSSQAISGADKKKKKLQQSQQKEARQSSTGMSSKNQSENILAKLQNLLVCKEQQKSSQARRGNYHQDAMQQQMLRQRQAQSAGGFQPGSQSVSRGANSQGANKRSILGGRIQTGTGSHNRKSANSIGSQGRSNTRLSRYSQNSKYSRSKSRVSRSKSSGKSGEKPANRSKSLSNERKNSKEKKLSNERKSQKVENSRKLLSRKSQTKHNIHDVPTLSNIQNQMLHSQSQLDSHPAAMEQLERAQSSFEMNHVISDLHHSTTQDKKRKSRQGSVLRNRPKSSMLPESKKENMQSTKSGGQKKKPTRKQPAQQQTHNCSIENLQRQVLENQKILLNNLVAQRSHKQSKRHPNHSNTGGPSGLAGIASSKMHHNHNNSITQMNNLTVSSLQGQNQAGVSGRATTGMGLNQNMMMAAERTAGPGLGFGSHKISKGQFQSQTTQNLHGHLNKSFLSSGTSGTKKKSAGQQRSGAHASGNTNPDNQHSSAKTSHQQQQQNLNQSFIQNNYNTSQMINHLSQNMQNIQRSDLSLKMTQQNLSSNLKPFGGQVQAGAGSTTASTTGAGHFMSGKTAKNRKMGGGPGAAIGGGGNNKRRGSITHLLPSHTQGQGTNPTNGQFVNFEQMQQQLEGGLTLGGVDLVGKNMHPAKAEISSPLDPQLQAVFATQQQHPNEMFSHVLDDDQLEQHVQHSAASSGAVAPPMPHHMLHNQQLHQQQYLANAQHHMAQQLPSQLSAGVDHAPATAMSFIPHKNLMPKTTGSQAHLLSIQEANNMKQYNSLNQTGRMMGSSLTKNASGGLMKKSKK